MTKDEETVVKKRIKTAGETDEKTDEKIKKGGKQRLIWRKTAVFFLVFLAVCGIITVDSACSDMLDKEGKLVPIVSRADHENISLSLFGQTAFINMKKLTETWNEWSHDVTTGLDFCVEEVRSVLGADTEKEEDDMSEKKKETKNTDKKQSGKNSQAIDMQTL